MYLKRFLLLSAVWVFSAPSLLMAQPDLLFFELPTSFLNPVGAGARAAGTGFAFISVADDATAASHNPAGLAQLVAPEVSAVGSYLMRLERPEDTAEIDEQTLRNPSLNFLSAVLPPMDLGLKYARKVVISLHMHRAFELKDELDFSGNLSGLNVSDVNLPNFDLNFRRKGSLFNITPAIAVKVSPTLSIGVAFNIWPDILDNGWETETTIRAGDGPPNTINSDFSFEGFNITGGVLWQITPFVALGGVFRRE
ncbi:MAG: hypothetical protein ETSY1_09610, partial [Candidatus Entotheonella factor]